MKQTSIFSIVLETIKNKNFTKLGDLFSGIPTTISNSVSALKEKEVDLDLSKDFKMLEASTSLLFFLSIFSYFISIIGFVMAIFIDNLTFALSLNIPASLSLISFITIMVFIVIARKENESKYENLVIDFTFAKAFTIAALILLIISTINFITLLFVYIFSGITNINNIISIVFLLIWFILTLASLTRIINAISSASLAFKFTRKFNEKHVNTRVDVPSKKESTITDEKEIVIGEVDTIHVDENPTENSSAELEKTILEEVQTIEANKASSSSTNITENKEENATTEEVQSFEDKTINSIENDLTENKEVKAVEVNNTDNQDDFLEDYTNQNFKTEDDFDNENDSTSINIEDRTESAIQDDSENKTQ